MDTKKALDWIDSMQEIAIKELIKLASINSWSHNPDGLKKMHLALLNLFQVKQNPSTEFLLFDVGEKRRKKILLGGHMDTVYPEANHFLPYIQGNHLIGPGVADMKGGLIVMWLALKAYEQFVEDKCFEFTVFISKDEEIGSPTSRPLWEKLAKQSDLGLIYEPCFSDGAFVDERKGSISFSIEVHGKQAHVGRDYHEGKSAVKAIGDLITQLYRLVSIRDDLTLNIANLKSDAELNVVVGHASLEVNIRSFSLDVLNSSLKMIHTICENVKKDHGLDVTIRKIAEKFPKIKTAKTCHYLEILRKSAHTLNIPFQTRASGGLSDGNILASSGLDNLDTMGALGGHLHTKSEYMVLDSLAKRAKLSFLFLLNLAKEHL